MTLSSQKLLLLRDKSINKKILKMSDHIVISRHYASKLYKYIVNKIVHCIRKYISPIWVQVKLSYSQRLKYRQIPMLRKFANINKQKTFNKTEPYMGFPCQNSSCLNHITTKILRNLDICFYFYLYVFFRNISTAI